jgi:hypothetical protein
MAMKKAIFTVLFTLLAIISAGAQRNGSVPALSGQDAVRLRQGDEITHARLKIHFIEVLDDSRCPEGTTCVWAGNAKVKITLAVEKRRGKEFELNSNLEPTAIEYKGYRIRFVSLTRRPTQPGRMTMVRPELVVSIAKIRR